MSDTRAQTARRLHTSADFAFDPLDPAVVRNPGPAYSALAAECPFYRYEGDEYQFYITSDYKEIRDTILSDNSVWSFKWGDGPVDWDTFSDFGILTDPPFHLEFISALRKGMTPRRMAYYRPEVERIADDLVSRMQGASEKRGNFHDLFALPLPARMMCFMLGADEALHADYKRWADDLVSFLFNDKDPNAEQSLIQEIMPHFMGLIEQRKCLLREAGVAEPTHEHWGTVLPPDYISLGLVSRVEGRRFNDQELFQICTTFLSAGQETTTSLLTNVVWRLLEVPERWDQLKANPDLIENAIEESLRFDPPINSHFRTSLCPVTMHGAELPAKSKLMFSMMGANRDPEIFSDPDTFRLDRPLNQSKRHLSFGYGVHFCLGAPIARLEAQIGLRKLVEGVPDLRLTGSPERINSWIYYGQRELPVAWS